MIDTDTIQDLVALLCIATLMFNFGVLYWGQRRHLVEVHILDNRPIARSLIRAIRSIVLWITIASLVLTVGSVLRNWYTLPISLPATPWWMPYLIALIFITFYTIIMVPGVVLYHSYRAISMLDAIDHEGRATPEMIHKMVGEKLDEAAATATDRYDQNTGEHSEAKQTATDRYNQNSEEHMELLREVKRKAERAEEVCNENKEEMKKWLNRFEKRDER